MLTNVNPSQADKILKAFLNNYSIGYIDWLEIKAAKQSSLEEVEVLGDPIAIKSKVQVDNQDFVSASTLVPPKSAALALLKEMMMKNEELSTVLDGEQIFCFSHS